MAWRVNPLSSRHTLLAQQSSHHPARKLSVRCLPFLTLNTPELEGRHLGAA